MNTKQSPLSKQQLFVHPISILEKQKAKQSQANETRKINIQPTLQGDVQNFNEFLLHAVDPQTDNIQNENKKTKHIFKQQNTLASAQNNKIKHYRTRMCSQGIECRKRLVCQFAHTQYELRKPYKNRKSPCIRYQKGLCTLAAACPDYHGNMDLKKKNYKYKTEKCKEWQQKGICLKGKLCIFIHNEDHIDSERSESFEDGENIVIQQINERVELVINGHHIDINEQENKANDEIQVKKQIENSIKIEAKDIFSSKSQKKKTIIAKQVVQQVIDRKQQEPSQIADQEQNFNIQFNF